MKTCIVLEGINFVWIQCGMTKASRWKKCTAWISNRLGASRCVIAVRKKTPTIIFVVPPIATLLVGENFQRCASQRRSKTELKFSANTLKCACYVRRICRKFIEYIS